MFEKIYCINLSKDTQRWEMCKDIFKKQGLMVERIEAINGTNEQNNCSHLKILPGEWGCWQSHLKIIKHAKKNNYKNILILEDDVVFTENLNFLIAQYSKQIPEKWDMFYLGGNHIKKPKLISKNILKLKNTRSAFCYALSQNLYDVIISFESLSCLIPIDIFYAEYIHSNFDCYCFYPHLAYQRAAFSNIQNKMVNYEFIKNYQLPIDVNYILKRPGDAIRRIIKKLRNIL